MPDRDNRALQAGAQALRAGRWADAANAFQQVLAREPAAPAANHGYGMAMLQLGQRTIAAAMLQRAVSADPQHPAYAHDLGRLLAQSEPARALELLARACALAPEDAAIADSYAQALLLQGQPLPAIDVLERACDGPSPSREAGQRLIELCYEHDEFDRLVRHQQALHQRWPQTRAAYRMGWTPAGPTAAPAAPLPAELAHAAEFAREANLHVVDDVLDDPKTYRDAALRLPYEAVQYAGQNFPGVQTEGQPCAAIMARIAALLGRTLKWDSPDNGAYRLSYASSLARADIHVDQPATESVRHHAAVLYLNLPAQCRGGTTFWRHRPTGWARRPTPAQLREQGYASTREFQQRWLKAAAQLPFDELTAGRADWEPIVEVPMRFNRLVVYRSDFFHSISEVFGNQPADGRLVQLFFFETAD